MLTNNGHQNSHCTFAEQLATYLYDEIAAQDKTAFESHLQNCNNCADELTDFSALRSSIIEWRATDFDSLPTPAFVLPTARQTVAEKRSLFETIRAFFNFSAAQTAFAAAALLLLSVGLIWLASSRSQNLDSGNLLAEKETPKLENSQLPIPEPTVDRSARNSPDKQTTDNSATIQSSSNNGKDSAGRNNLAPVKQSAPSALPVVQRNSGRQVTTKSNQNPAIKTPTRNNQPPVDEDDDDDDNSLRLTDLFDEVGMTTAPDQEDYPHDK